MLAADVRSSAQLQTKTAGLIKRSQAGFRLKTMSTQALQINCNTRPVRLAFLVDKPDPSTLEKVFELNTLLWGGILNPVVVLDGSTRKQVGRHYILRDSTYEQEQLWLLQSFDPDILINYSNTLLPDYLAQFKGRTFSLEAMRWNPWGTQEIISFLEVWPFLEQHWRKEVRFLQKPHQTKYGHIDVDVFGPLRTFLIARFGNYPKDSYGNVVLDKHFGGQLVTYDESFRKSLSLDEWVFPIHITTLQLDVHPPGTLDNHMFFLLDPENMFDIVDFWNLRAAGFRVFVLPASHYQDFSDAAKLFAERSVYPINENVKTLAEIVKARSIDDSQLEEAGKWLMSLGTNPGHLSLKGWVPMFRNWGPDHTVHPEIQMLPPTGEETSEVVVFNEGHGTLRVSGPDCELRGPHSLQHWATDILALGSTDEKRTFRLPWLHPECDALTNLRFLGIGQFPSRVSRHGIVVLTRGDRENLGIQEPQTTEVLRAYLKDGGFTYLKTSTPGLTTERIIEQLGGLMPCAVFKNSGVREIIDTLSRGANRPYIWVREIIFKSLTGDDKKQEFERILSSLLMTKVLRQGFELQCERCRQHDWYHLTDLSEHFTCKKCFRIQQVPHLRGGQWRYVVDGLFRLKGKVAGCLTAILSLLFLEQFLSHEAKYVSSFDYSDGTTHAERDFALLMSGFLQEDVDVVIGECKSLSELKQNQRDAVKRLGEKTGAYLAFCTLSEVFTPDDKLFFEQLLVARQKLILLTRKHLEMPYLEISKYRHESRWIGRKVELISRLTIREVLGDEVADKHRLHLWVKKS
jgi:hypothetical protein